MVNEPKFLDPKNDYAFKRLFGDERHKDILKAFLNDLLADAWEPIEELRLIPTHYSPEAAASHPRWEKSVIDVQCRGKTGREFIVEIDGDGEPFEAKRVFSHTCLTYGRLEMVTGPRARLPILFLIILKGQMLSTGGNPSGCIFHLWRFCEAGTPTCVLDHLAFSCLELGKSDKGWEESGTAVEKWAYFLKHAPDMSPEERQNFAQDCLSLSRSSQEVSGNTDASEKLPGS
jgi:predicted transposase/invertase (TIGR01784 family)